MSDGTPDGTVLVKDIYPPSENDVFSAPYGLTNVNGRLYFSAADGVHGRELWLSDGTPDGTFLLKNINLDPNPLLDPARDSDPSGFTGLNGMLFFSADAVPYGRELWKTGGTPDGTVMVKDIHPGPGNSSAPSGFTPFNGKLFFVADDCVNGPELRKTDGTPEGTVQVQDINIGPLGSYPRGLTYVNGTLFFVADDGFHGEEVWYLPLEQPEIDFRRGDCNSDGEVRGVVTDAVFLLNFNFLGGTRPSCFAACDANADGQVSGVVTDAVYLLTFNFLGGPPPPEPFPGCGLGTAADLALGCETPSESCGSQGQNP